jgi:3-hydroxyisobutyrate dehydrogenase
MRVGFIGVGNIGRPMAERILGSGLSLVVHDIREEAAAPLVRLGASWAGSPRAVAEQCDVVCTCLPGPREMEEVVWGKQGLALGIAAGAAYVDFTTNSPTTVKMAHRALAEKGVNMLDAPVSGGMEGAKTGDLTVLVGGDQATLERCRPVLEAVGKTIIHVGGAGAGCVAKITHNCASFSAGLAMIEALTLGVKAGVEPSKLVEVFQKCALGKSFDLHRRLPETLFRGDFEPRFALKWTHKDMLLAADLAREYEVPMALVEACEREMSTAMSRGWGDMDGSIYLTVQEERAGVQVRSEGE